MKLKFILFIGLVTLIGVDACSMQWLGGDKAVQGILDVVKNECGDGDTVAEAVDSLVKKAGGNAREEVRQVMRTARTEMKATIAGVLGTKPDLDAAGAAQQFSQCVKTEYIDPLITHLQNGIDACEDKITDFLGAPRGTTLPVATKQFAKDLGKKVLIAGAAVGTVVLACYLLKKITHPGSLNKSNLSKSNLVVESSGFSNGIASRFFNLLRKNQPLKKMILANNLADKAAGIARDLVHTIKNSGTLRFKSLILNGPKGTGKTFFADYLIKLSNLDYVKINSSSFINFEDGTESKAISAIFGLLKSPKKQIIVVIDEADILLNRTAYKTKMMDLIKWLKTNNHKFMLIFCAENKKSLDREFLALMDQNLEFSIPTEHERKKFLQHNIIVLVKELGSYGLTQNVNSVLNVEKIEEIAKETDGFSYSQLESLFGDLKIEILRNHDKMTKELVSDVVQNNLEIRAALNF